jgi:adenylate cyclase
MQDLTPSLTHVDQVLSLKEAVDWAVGFVGRSAERPDRIGVHLGTALYRDGDNYGREVNLASRIVARARGGEVLVSDSIVEALRDASELSFEGIGQVKLKGFDEPRQLCRATFREGS